MSRRKKENYTPAVDTVWIVMCMCFSTASQFSSEVLTQYFFYCQFIKLNHVRFLMMVFASVCACSFAYLLHLSLFHLPPPAPPCLPKMSQVFVVCQDRPDPDSGSLQQAVDDLQKCTYTQLYAQLILTRQERPNRKNGEKKKLALFHLAVV